MNQPHPELCKVWMQEGLTCLDCSQSLDGSMHNLIIFVCEKNGTSVTRYDKTLVLRRNMKSIPHDFNIWIIIPSKIRMGSVCSHNIFINCTLDIEPKLVILILWHVQSATGEQMNKKIVRQFSYCI